MDWYHDSVPLTANPAFDHLAHGLGVEGEAHETLIARVKGQRVRLELLRRREERHASGLRITIAFEGKPVSSEGGPQILLRAETTQDGRDKERGLAREVQTGFEGFDAAVYVDHSCSDQEALRVLGREATRQAALRLIEQADATIRIHRGEVVVKLPLNQRTKPSLLEDALDDALILSRAGGPKGDAVEQRGSTLLALSMTALGLAVLYVGILNSLRPTAYGAIGVGVVVAALFALFSRPSIEDACAGDSGSPRRAMATIVGFSMALGLFTYGILVHLGGS